MAGPATLPPPGPRGIRPNHRAAPTLPGSRPPPAPLPPLARPCSPAGRPPAVPSPGTPAAPAQAPAGPGGNGGGMRCRLRGGGSLGLRARLRGHAHRRRLGSPIGPPASGALGQSKGAMESGGRGAEAPRERGRESPGQESAGADGLGGRSLARREKVEGARPRAGGRAGWLRSSLGGGRECARSSRLTLLGLPAATGAGQGGRGLSLGETARSPPRHPSGGVSPWEVELLGRRACVC